MFAHACNFARGPRGAAALLGFALLFAPAPASAQTPVFFGDTISDPGVYFLAGNQSGSGNGIVIASDDVALLLGRFTLRGDGSSSGIISEGNENVLIHGGRVTNFRNGVGIVNGEHCTLKDMRIDHCTATGLVIINTFDSFFSRLRCDNNGGNGLEASDVDDSRFLSILAHDNRWNGILLGSVIVFAGEAFGIDGNDSTHNKIKLCWAAYNGLDGIRLLDADDNDIERNQCVGNSLVGIRLGSTFADEGVVNAEGSQDNFLRSNWCVFNGAGIAIEWGSGSNTLTNNTALANFAADMIDRNFEVPCVNTWFLNFFFTKDGAGADCIF